MKPDWSLLHKQATQQDGPTVVEPYGEVVIPPNLRGQWTNQPWPKKVRPVDEVGRDAGQ